jgi:GDP/UDP-N,N'-diacetylbacillosamine 2-epimerase (hydrolysing)
MTRICVPIGCRSDEGLSAPVIKRLGKHFEVITLNLIPQDFLKSYALTAAYIVSANPDLVFITGDRVEMCAAAAAAFHNKVKIAHFYAGVVNDPITTFDDVDRHCITLWSDIQFCEDWGAVEVVWDIFGATQRESNEYIVGISHLDDLEVDESKVPTEFKEDPTKYGGNLYEFTKPYDLILINDQPLLNKLPIPDYTGKGKLIIQIGGNPDGWMNKLIGNDLYYPNLPRPQFLGLLKNCQRFITNSSAAIYEAPHFLKPEQIIMVGDRNRNRPRGPFKTGASDRIVEILKEYLK